MYRVNQQETFFLGKDPQRLHVEHMNTFSFQAFQAYGRPEHRSEISETFLSWLVGFFEGDGSITQWRSQGKLRIRISLDQKDPALLYFVRSTLGFGVVRSYQRDHETYWSYIVEDQENIKRWIYLLNGNLVLQARKDQFSEMLTTFNRNNPLQEEICIQKNHPLPSLHDGWLSGFFEAECGFDGNFTRDFRNQKYADGSTRYAIKLKFYITQKLMDPAILHYIGELFQLPKIRIYTLQTPRKLGPFLYYRLEVSTAAGHDKIISYLQEFPIRGKKRFAFQRFVLLRRRQLTRGSSFETPRMAKRTARLINHFVQSREHKDMLRFVDKENEEL